MRRNPLWKPTASIGVALSAVGAMTGNKPTTDELVTDRLDYQSVDVLFERVRRFDLEWDEHKRIIEVTSAGRSEDTGAGDF